MMKRPIGFQFTLPAAIAVIVADKVVPLKTVSYCSAFRDVLYG